MENMQCQNQNHNSEKVLTVCMDKQCKNKPRLSCVLCQIELHNSHQKKAVEVGRMNAFIQQESKKQHKYPESCSYGQKQLIQGLEKLLSLIDNLQKIMKEKIERIKQQNLADYLKKVVNNQQGIDYWNQIVEGMLQYVEVDNCLIKLTTSKEGELNEMEEQEMKIIKQCEQSLNNMLNQIGPTQIKLDAPIQIQIEKLFFKENKKHVDIAIINQSTIKKTKTDSYAMAFADERFDPNYQSYAFAFNIQKIYGQWIGVGNDEAGNVPSYLFNNYSQIGHGQYMIAANRCIFHHTDEQLNFKYIGITFKAGDKVQIKYDHVNKELEFRNQSTQDNVVRIPITDMTKKLYPCAMLYYPESQVQLVEY